MTITEEVFGNIKSMDNGSLEIRRFTLSNESGMAIKVMSYGAAITSIYVKDAIGNTKDVIFGYDNFEEYVEKNGNKTYFGATIGRVANRIRGGKFKIEAESFQLDLNNGENHLHGGFNGFDTRVWESRTEGEKVVFSYLSKDGEEGYPGVVQAEVSYEVTEENEIYINYEATTTKPTPICLTNHSHFNLAGHEAGGEKLENHIIELNSDEYTPVDASFVPIGTKQKVEDTVYDLRTPRDLHQLLQTFPSGPTGYDVNFCVNRTDDSRLNFVSRVTNTQTGITLEAFSDQPGVQLYTGNFFPDPENNETPIIGKGKQKYYKHGAFCLETQNYPNAINTPGFPNAILKPGDVYKHSTVFKFSTA